MCTIAPMCRSRVLSIGFMISGLGALACDSEATRLGTGLLADSGFVDGAPNVPPDADIDSADGGPPPSVDASNDPDAAVPLDPDDAGFSDASVDDRPCPELGLDVCVASSRCVLFGSLVQDPGYVCRDAIGDCEPIVEPDQCDANAACEWDPGDCYCPRGSVCTCSGGPAPRCRNRCGGLLGFTCPAGRYCEDAVIRPPNCPMIPDSAGLCEWAPNDCTGTPSGPVCACDRLTPRTYANDCLRRQAAVGVAVAGACAM